MRRCCGRVLILEVARLDQIPEEDRLNPEKLMLDLKSVRPERGVSYASPTPIFHRKTPTWLKSAQGGDIVCVFSNGGFGGIHEKLLKRLKG